MNSWHARLLCLLTLLLPVPLAATRAIAVLDFQPKGIENVAAKMVSERLRTELVATGFFTVVERSQMQEILREQGFQQTGCTSTECAVEAGQLIGVTHLVAGSVAQVRDVILISVRMVDVERGEVMLSADDMDSHTLRSALTDGIDRLVRKILGGGKRGDPAGDTVFVSSPAEFIAAIGSNTTIALRPGSYNISNQSRHKNPAVTWANNYDGKYPIVTGVKNMTITTRPGVKAEVVIDPAYGWTFEFVGCANIALHNLTLGHTEPGFCLGGVLRFRGSENVRVTRCDLYGSGTYGVVLDTVAQFTMTESIIRECTYGIMQIRQSRNIAFRDCRMLRNREFTLISVDACDNVVYEECLFEGNTGPTLFRVTEDNDAVRVDRCRFVNNDVTKFARTMGTFSAVACEFMKNTFTDHRETSGSAPRPTPRIEAYLRGKYSHAFTETDRVSATDLGKRCMRYCTNRSIAWSRHFLKHVPNDEGYGASFTLTPDGGCLIVGTLRKGNRRKHVPCVIKLDRHMEVQWERFPTKPKRGFKAYEGCGGAVCADGGYLVMMKAYVNPATGGIGWFAKFDSQGNVVWETFMNGKGNQATPFPQWYQVDGRRGLRMEGHIYPTLTDAREERAFNWYGKIDGRGKLVVDSVGVPLKGE